MCSIKELAMNLLWCAICCGAGELDGFLSSNGLRNASDHTCFYGHFRLWISACTGSRQAGIINMVVCDKPYPILLAQKQWIVQYTDRPNVHKTLIHECFYLEDCRQIGEPRMCRSGSFSQHCYILVVEIITTNPLCFFPKGAPTFVD